MAKVLYGIWIRGKGWLRGNGEGGEIVAFEIWQVARDTARRVGGQVRYIDESLKDLEQNIKSLEQQKKWWQFWRRK